MPEYLTIFTQNEQSENERIIIEKTSFFWPSSLQSQDLVLISLNCQLNNGRSILIVKRQRQLSKLFKEYFTIHDEEEQNSYPSNHLFVETPETCCVM